MVKHSLSGQANGAKNVSITFREHDAKPYKTHRIQPFAYNGMEVIVIGLRLV